MYNQEHYLALEGRLNPDEQAIDEREMAQERDSNQ